MGNWGYNPTYSLVLTPFITGRVPGKRVGFDSTGDRLGGNCFPLVTMMVGKKCLRVCGRAILKHGFGIT